MRIIRSRGILAFLLPLLVLSCAKAAYCGDAAKRPIDVGSRKQLLIDYRFVDSSRGVTFTVNPPHRDGRLLIVADQPWEAGASVYVYSSVLKDQGKVRIWYDLFRPTGSGPYDHERRVAYAESKDGLRFTKPELHLHEVEGSTANNVVLPGVIGGCAVWIDPMAEPEGRYKTQAKVYPGGRLHMHSSPDGLGWKLAATLNPGPGGWDTQSIVFWDPAVSRYVLYTRYWMEHPALGRYRTVRRLESDDLRDWENQAIVVQPDEIDLATHQGASGQPPVDYYGADVFRYAEAEDVYIMLAQTYWHWQTRPEKGLGPATFDVRLAVSRDGKDFQWPGNREAFLRNGPAGRFDSRMVWALPDPVRMGDELWIYYAGTNFDHAGNVDPAADGKKQTGISRAVLRLDGFVSADAGPAGGVLTTPPIRFTGRRLELNADASGGSLLVELLDEQGKPLAGCTKPDADVIQSDLVRVPVRWAVGEDVSRFAGQPVRIRFHMRNCKLYAFQFRD